MNINLKDHFSDKEVKHINRLSKTVRKRKRVGILTLIMCMIFCILNVHLAVSIGRCHGITGFGNVLSLFYSTKEIGKVYQGYEVVISDCVGNAHLIFGVAVLSLVLSYCIQKNTNLLMRCWRLLSTEKKAGGG